MDRLLPLTQETNVLTLTQSPPALYLKPVKDIQDFDGVHGDWLEHAAVTLVVHHHHEEIAAGDLLDHKGPANHSKDSQKQKKDEEGREGEQRED